MPANKSRTKSVTSNPRPIDAAEILDWKQILTGVTERHEEYVIRDGGEPVAAFVPFATYQQWLKARRGSRQEFAEIVNRIHCRTEAESPRRIRALINEAVREVRK
ncbi:MAG: hypothetical protein HYY29_00780 [Chloroflexi bacterium]|nr:hypothetical protein [Chloroflexota bacterium]